MVLNKVAVLLTLDRADRTIALYGVQARGQGLGELMLYPGREWGWLMDWRLEAIMVLALRNHACSKGKVFLGQK